jgi:hypothetical protein
MEFDNKLKPKKHKHSITTASVRGYKPAFQYQTGYDGLKGIKGETNFTIDPNRVSIKANKAFAGLYALLVDGKPVEILNYPSLSKTSNAISNFHFFPERYKDLTKFMEQYNAYDRDRANQNEKEGYWFDV